MSKHIAEQHPESGAVYAKRRAMAMQSSRQILVVGSLNMDVVAIAPRIPVAGETIIGSRYLNEPGGKGANQAYAAARLGGRVAMLGCVGQDDFGKRMRRNLEAAGCDVSGLETADVPSGVAVIFVAETGQNSIVVVPGANGEFLAARVASHTKSFEDSGVVLLQLETPLETVQAAAARAKRANARVILDPAPAPNEPLSKDLLALIDILTPNETEAAILAGLAPRRLSKEEAEPIARKLRALGPTVIILKLGDQGCLLLEDDRAALIPSPQVEAVDTTAAGDVFNAALAVGLTEEMDLSEACRFAVRASALSVTRLGAQAAVPTRQEVDDWRSSARLAP